MFRLIAIDFPQKSPHFSLNLKVVGALGNYSLVFVIFINFFWTTKRLSRTSTFFLISCLKGQVKNRLM